MLDVERAARTSGSRFVYLLGDIVQVQFALVRHALDLLTARGFVPVIPPVLVREEAMFGSGFLPTDEVNIYVTSPDELYLVGTSEVSLAAFHATEILDEEDLPIRYAATRRAFAARPARTARTWAGCSASTSSTRWRCSRSRDRRTLGRARVHGRIEEEIVGTLDLPYRIVNVAAGDLGAAAAKKYDLEVWLPGQGGTGSSRPARTTPTTAPAAGRPGSAAPRARSRSCTRSTGTATAIGRT